MLQCLVETCRLIDSDASAMSGAPISADELMPLATYVMLRAQVGLTARDRVGFGFGVEVGVRLGLGVRVRVRVRDRVRVR